MANEFERSVQRHLDANDTQRREMRERESIEVAAYRRGVADLQRALKDLAQFLSSKIPSERFFVKKSRKWYLPALYSPQGYLLSKNEIFMYVLTADGRIWTNYIKSEYMVMQPNPGSTWSNLAKIGGWSFSVDESGSVTAYHYDATNETATTISMNDALSKMAANAIEAHNKDDARSKHS